MINEATEVIEIMHKDNDMSILKVCNTYEYWNTWK